MLLQGDLDGAGSWVDSITDPPPDMALLWLEEPQVTRARVLMARGTDADLQSAQLILDALEEITERTYNTRLRVEIMALRALALDAQGETGEAEAALKQAIDLALPGGFIRVFVDLGQGMAVILRRLADQCHSVEAIGRILAAFQQDDITPVSRADPAQLRRPASVDIPVLAEPLTHRELEVLNLLSRPVEHQRNCPQTQYFLRHCKAPHHQPLRQAWSRPALEGGSQSGRAEHPSAPLSRW